MRNYLRFVSVQTNGYHHEATNGHYHNVGNEIAQQNSQSELQHCHQTIANLEGRIVLLEKMCRDYESRLQVPARVSFFCSSIIP